MPRSAELGVPVVLDDRGAQQVILDGAKASNHEIKLLRLAHVCERIAVMYAGNLVEVASADDILDDPKHPYTVGLIASIPRIDREAGALQPIPGRLADPVSPPPGCKFNPRCAYAFDRCRVERPVLKTLAPGRQVACHLHD